MTREEAKKRLEVWLICANCPEDKMCYDSHLHSICEYTDYCDEVPIEEAVKVAIEALEQEPCDKCVYSTSEGCQYDDITETIPPVTPQLKSECEHDHEILKAYSDGANAVLDNVRAEIEELAKPNKTGGRGNGKSVRYGLCKALEIIDKYKEEGSGEE